MNVHLIDGTYELFRHFFGVPAAADVSGQEIGAVRGVLTSVLSMIERGATHIGVATDRHAKLWVGLSVRNFAGKAALRTALHE
jgi:hypothetical protein